MQHNLCRQRPWAWWSSQIFQHCAGSCTRWYRCIEMQVSCHKRKRTGGRSILWFCTSVKRFLIALVSHWYMTTLGSYCCLFFWTPLEVAVLSLPWSPSEMGAGYRTGGGFINSTTDLGGYGTVVGQTVGYASIVLHFANIVQTTLMPSSWELQRLTGTSLSATDKECMACVILSSNVTNWLSQILMEKLWCVCDKERFYFSINCLDARIWWVAGTTLNPSPPCWL